MHKQPTKQKTSKTKQCLLALTDIMKEQRDLWINLIIGASHPLYYSTFRSGGAEAVQRRRAKEALRTYNQHVALLKRQRWIEVRKIGHTLQMRLTVKGKKIALKEQMKASLPCNNNECIIVIFDIPEQERLVRRQFRTLLKECRFVQLQRSVWMSRCDVLASLQKFIQSTNSDGWIRAFRALNVS